MRKQNSIVASEQANPRIVAAALLAICIALSACKARDADQSNVAASATPIPASAASKPGTIAAMFRQKGPEMLSTVGLYDGQPTREVKANEGTFSIQEVGGLDTLMVNGKPAYYQSTGETTRPEAITANESLYLVGVFELPTESIAWALITGGSACAGTHVLIPVRSGVALPGQAIPGYDDRGTMRLAGDRITFEAGGSTGFLQNDLLTVEGPESGV